MTTSSKTRAGLGRGFDALIPTNFDTSILQEPNEKIQKIDHDKIKPSSDQPRKHFDETALRELADSIRQYGVVQPLVVTAEGEKYVIVAGERRWRASKMAGLKTVPVIVRSHKELEKLEIALVENVQRVDLSALEQAVSIQRLHDQFSMTFDDIAKRLGKATTTVNNIVRLLQLPEEAKEALNTNVITEGHARAILALKHLPEKQAELLHSIQQYGWSVRKAEQFVTTYKEGLVSKSAMKQRMASTSEETIRLEKLLHSPVSIRRTAKGGRLEMQFSSEEELQRLLSLLLGLTD